MASPCITQCPLWTKEDLDVGFAQVGRLVEKKVSFASVQDKTVKRFTLDPFKLYLDSCATYHSAFVHNMLSSVKTGNTVLQGNCNTGVSTSQEKGVYGLYSFWLNKKVLQTFSLFLNLRRMVTPSTTTPSEIG